MKRAFYMRFVKGGDGLHDRTGGLPTHLPPEVPHCWNSGEEMAFLAQFYCTPERPNLPDTLCIQLYQCRDVGMGDDPVPVVVQVPLGANPNSEKVGIAQRAVDRYHIEWEPKDDPDVVPLGPDPTEEELQLAESKVGGTPYEGYVLEPGEVFLLQLEEDPAGFNFAGRTAMVVIDVRGQLQVRLA